MVALAGVQGGIGRRLKADQPRRSAAVVDGAVHLAHGNEDPLPGFDGRIGVALAQRAATLQHHDHVFRLVVQVLGKLLARLMLAVVQGEPARAHLRVHDGPVVALPMRKARPANRSRSCIRPDWTRSRRTARWSRCQGLAGSWNRICWRGVSGTETGGRTRRADQARCDW